MPSQRSADPQAKTHYRSARVSYVNGQFFFSTREGTLEGPYCSREDAERYIARYIDRVTTADSLLRHCKESIDNLQRRAAIKHALGD